MSPKETVTIPELVDAIVTESTRLCLGMVSIILRQTPHPDQEQNGATCALREDRARSSSTGQTLCARRGYERDQSWTVLVEVELLDEPSSRTSEIVRAIVHGAIFAGVSDPERRAGSSLFPITS